MTAGDAERLTQLVDDVLASLAVLQADGERRLQDLAAMSDDIRRAQADQRRRFLDRVFRFVCLPLRRGRETTQP